MLSDLDIGMAWAEIQEYLKIRSADKIYLKSLLKLNMISETVQLKIEFG